MRISGFGRRERQAIHEPAAGPAYVERRRGESAEAFEARLAAGANERTAATGTGEARDAYAAGRRDQQRVEPPAPPRRRHGFGLVGFLVVLVAAIGVVWVVLAAREGSFAAGGAVVDQKLAEVTSPARVAATQAVDRTGQAVKNAGQTLEAQGERIQDTAK
jgi:hypothetical protein